MSHSFCLHIILTDVIVGSNCSKHPGNVKFSQFISAYKKARAKANPSVEAAVKEVVVFWRNLSPRGRFLAQNKNSGDGRWHEVEDKQAMRIASFFLLKQTSGSGKRSSKSSESMNQRSSQGQILQGQNQQQAQISGQFQGQSQPQMQFQGKLQMQGQMQGQVQMQVQNHMQGQVQMQVQNQMQGQMQPQRSAQRQGEGQFQGQGFNLGEGQFQGQVNKPQSQSMNQGQNFQNRGLDQQFQGAMASFEPAPIGSSNSNSIGSHPPATMSQNFQEPIASQSMAKSDPDFDHLDFTPLPFSFNNNAKQDFDPLPCGWSSNGKTNQMQNATDQVQVSVNMVVNTLPGFQKDTSVNTVTNIQIGTGSGNMLDDRNSILNDSFSKPYSDSFSSSNFQLTTDSPNSFIQISTQSNTQGSDSMNYGLPSGTNFANNANKGTSRPMNDFQTAFFGGTDDSADTTSVSFGFQGSANMTTTNAQAFSDNVGSAMGNNVTNRSDGLQLNKNKVGDAVPCAASLLSCFDEW